MAQLLPLTLRADCLVLLGGLLVPGAFLSFGNVEACAHSPALQINYTEQAILFPLCILMPIKSLAILLDLPDAKLKNWISACGVTRAWGAPDKFLDVAIDWFAYSRILGNFRLEIRMLFLYGWAKGIGISAKLGKGYFRLSFLPISMRAIDFGQ